MADSQVPIQPVSPQPASPPAAVKVFTAVDEQGRTVLIQAMTALDEFGRPIIPMSEATGQDILQAIKALHQTMVLNGGGLMPSTRGITQ